MRIFPFSEPAHTTVLLLTASLLLAGMPRREATRDTGAEAFADEALAATVKVESVCIYDRGTLKIGRTGAGVITSADGLILTNFHNVDGATQIHVTRYDGHRYRATLIARDPRRDLALLRIDARNLPVMRLGDEAALRVGESVFAIGNPHHLDFTLTSGVIGGFDRRIDAIPAPDRIERFIQTDVPINPGCSGGPLLNRRGELIGINTAIVSDSGRFEGYSFAVPVSMLRDFLAHYAPGETIARAELKPRHNPGLVSTIE